MEFHEVLDRALSQLKSIRERRTEPLAIIGMACRFPGASSPKEFWDLLSHGRCEITETPADRWNGRELQADTPGQKGRITSNHGGFIKDADLFDASFFNLSGREANLLDPQQRLLLEVAWETLENAGINPQSTKGSATGAYIGICSSDYLHLVTRHNASELDAWVSTGNAHGSAAGRLSYVFDWRGPCLAVDTACSSSLVALHLAVQAIRNEECRTAFVAGVNLMLAPDLSISLSQAGMLSPDGRCKTFSEAANGFVRGEGCGAILIKRLSHAVADGDPIVCLIRGSATNQDGRSIGLTAPNGLAQQAVIRAAHANARLSPSHISYIEAHGTGTALGDPIEMSALQEVFAPARSQQDPLIVGSVKTNLGHLEGAAGMAGVIKTALALCKQTIPPHLHCAMPSTKIDWQWPVKLPNSLMSWPNANGHRRTAGVSSFGFGGSNAHVILEESRAEDASEHRPNPQGSLLKLSAKSQLALRDLARVYHARLNDDELESLCNTSCVGRADFSRRIAIPATTARDMKKLLEAWIEGDKQVTGLYTNHSDENLRTCWILSEQFNPDVSHSQALYERDRLFKQEWDTLNSIVESFWPWNLADLVWRQKASTKADLTIRLVALQYIYGRMMIRWGVEPFRVLGEGLGELSAGCLTGLFSIHDALRMASDATYADQVKISQGDYPYQSTRMNSKFAGSIFTTSYWRNVQSVSVRVESPTTDTSNTKGMVPLIFGDQSVHLPVSSNGISRIEPIFVFPAAREEAHDQILHLASRLYVAGAGIDWNAVFPIPIKKTSLPTYPFQRKSHWFKASSKPESTLPKRHPLLDSQSHCDGDSNQVELDLNTIPFLQNHRVRDVCLCPLTFLLELALAGGNSHNYGDLLAVKVSNLTIQRPVLWNSRTPFPLRATYTPSDIGIDCRFEVTVSNVWAESSQCRVSPIVEPRDPLPSIPNEFIAHSIEDHYDRFLATGLTYKHEFRCVRSIMSNPVKDSDILAWGKVVLPDDVDAGGYFFHPALLDGCLQITMTVLKERGGLAWMPVGVREYRFYRSPQSREVVSIVRQVEQGENQEVCIRLTIMDSTNSVVAEIIGLTLKEVSYNAEALLGLRIPDSHSLTEVGFERSPADFAHRIPNFIQSRIAAILDLSEEELDLARPMIDLGMDSIMAIELRNEILGEFQLELSMEELLDILTPGDLIARLTERLECHSMKPKDLKTRNDWVEGAI